MDTVPKTNRTWAAKFRDAFRGVKRGISGQSSFGVHGVMAGVVVAAAAALQVSQTDWCLLILCITGVLVAELFNSALEYLAQAVDHQHNEALGAALDIASGAVLVAAIGAAILGAIVFLPYLWQLAAVGS